MPFAVQAVAPGTVGTGTDTIEIDGSKFDNKTTFQLLGPSNTVVNSQAVYLQDSSTAFVTFDLTGMPTGTYTVQAVAGDGTTVQLTGALTVVAATPAGVQIHLSYPSQVLRGSEGEVTVSFSNESNTDAMAPLLQISATNALLRLQDQTSFTSTPLSFLGISANGPAGTLRPGESGQVSIPYQVTGRDGSQINFDVQIADDSQPMDWASEEAALQPATIPNAAWPIVFNNFVTNVGGTVASYHAVLAADATYFSQLGTSVYDVGQLVHFELEKADNAFIEQTLVSFTADQLSTNGAPLLLQLAYQQPISGRYYQGLLGLGWTTNWDMSTSVQSNGDVLLDLDGAAVYFALQPDGSYQDTAGSQDGTLTLSNGAFQMVADDVSYQFNPNGTLSYVQDVYGNRITAAYNAAGRLASLTASNGASFTLTYNSQGHLSQLTDSAGGSISFSYDPTGQFLTGYTDPSGTTSFTYVTGQSPAQNNALTSVTNAAGVQTDFLYDSEGRLTSQSVNGSAEKVTFSYGSAGGYTETNADGDSTTVLFSASGTEVIDPLGNVTQYVYNSDNQLSSVITPEGTTTYTHDAAGNTVAATDPLGNTTTYTYAASGQVATITDPNGNTTSYAYDANGELLSTTYANGSQFLMTYNSLGQLTKYVDADGNVATYAYNSQGLLATEQYSDGTSYSYTYDARSNLLTISDNAGNVTTLTYGDASYPDNVTEVQYPDGTYLKYTYNAAGQRTSVQDQTGYTVTYTYNGLGQLAEMTDSNGTALAQYTYDQAGQLTQTIDGNGQLETYAYDADGNMIKHIRSCRKITLPKTGDFVYCYYDRSRTDCRRPPEVRNSRFHYG